MNTVVFIPFAASAALALVSHIVVTRVRPRAAMWALAVAMPVLALCSVGALVVLACPLPARVPLIAAIGRWAPGAVESHTPVAPLVSLAACALLAWVGARVWRATRVVGGEVRVARAGGVLQRASTDVVVVDDPVPHAHAAGVGLFGWGRIVVSAGLVQLLDPDERAAVIAHERAHLRQHHAVVAVASRLSVALNPLLRPVGSDLLFAMERAADEAAAESTSREALASALARTALAAVEAARPRRAQLALHRHAVVDRVAALLDRPAQQTGAAWMVLGVAVVATVAVAWALHDTERFFEAARLWSRR